MTTRPSLQIIATCAAAGLLFVSVPATAAPNRTAPAAGSTGRPAAPADNVPQNGATPSNAGQPPVANRPAPAGNSTAGNNAANANNANANANANSNANAANASAHHEHQHRRSVHNEVMVPLYGYVPYNGLWNEGFGYNNGWYDYSDIGPYIDNSNSGQTDASGFVSSNTNAESPAPLAGPTTSAAPPPQLSADAQSARAAMIQEQERIMKEFEAKPEYQAALKDLKQATDNFNAAVAKAHASLEQSPEYQQATAQQAQAEQKVEAEQAGHRVGPTTEASPTATSPNGSYSLEVTRAAEQKLNAKKELTSLQKENINNSPQVKQAREKLNTAVMAFDAQKAKLAETVMADKDWQAAKQKYDAAAEKG